MITLYTFGPYFGLPDPSPFVMKAEVLLKMANLPFETDTGGFSEAPKGKLPYIADGGEIIADSTLIRLHIEKKYGFDFDAGLSRPERGVAWAFEKMCEDHLYWAGSARALDDRREFRQGTAPVLRFRACSAAPIDHRHGAASGAAQSVVPGHGPAHDGGDGAAWCPGHRCYVRLPGRQGLSHG